MNMKPMLRIRYALLAVGLVLATCSVSVWSAQTVHLKLTIDGNEIEGESTVSSL